MSDHFITFSIVDGNIKYKNEQNKYVEVQNISSASIANFKNAIGKSNLLSQLDLNYNADIKFLHCAPRVVTWYYMY